MVKKKDSNTKKSLTVVKPQETNNVINPPAEKSKNIVIDPQLTENKKRYFKCIYVDEKTNIVNCVGRYSGKKPKQAANKALTAMTKQFKEQGIKTNGMKINFGVIEQTRGSKRKKYYYQGIRNILKNPVPVSIKKIDKKTGTITEEIITYKHQSNVKKISCTDCPILSNFNPKKEVLEDGLDESEKHIKVSSKKSKKNDVKQDEKKHIETKIKKVQNEKKVKVVKKTKNKNKKTIKKNN